jgi:hypothetical protein
MVGLHAHLHDVSQLFYFTPGKYCDYICYTIAGDIKITTK